jgi:polar amino acid transport system substrate-binding protein
MLQQNQVEAISTDDTILAGLAKQDPFTKVLPAAITEEPYGMAMQKEQTDFVQFVNAVLERMRSDGTWTRVYTQWLAGLLGTAATPPVAEYR